jgi:glucose 1-dehydrogenase
VRQLTKVMALSLAKHGIRVNAIGPGTIMTEMLEDVLTDDDIRTRMLSRTPIGRIGEASEIAALRRFWRASSRATLPAKRIYADGGRLVPELHGAGRAEPRACSLNWRSPNAL